MQVLRYTVPQLYFLCWLLKCYLQQIALTLYLICKEHNFKIGTVNTLVKALKCEHIRRRSVVDNKVNEQTYGLIYLWCSDDRDEFKYLHMFRYIWLIHICVCVCVCSNRNTFKRAKIRLSKNYMRLNWYQHLYTVR